MRLVFITLLLPFVSFSQSHHEFWSKTNLTKTINNHWSIGLDLQYRQQSDFNTGDKDIFHFPLTRSLRSWAYYQTKNKWTIVISPMAYFIANELKKDQGDVKRTEEMRFTGGVMKGFNLNKLKINNRLLAEYRIIDLNNPGQFSQWRFRLQNMVTIPIHSTKKTTGLNYLASSELFLQSQTQKILFDQERLFNALQWKFKHFDVDLGYQWSIQKTKTTTVNRNQWVLIGNIII